MNYETARNLLVSQTTTTEENPDALLMRMKQGKPPVPGQITSILLALKVVFEGLKEASNLDRELVFALYQLGVKAPQIFVAGRKAGIDWPPLLKEDLLRISLATESIFSGVWQTPPIGGFGGY
ncbi:Dethiobiotin synthetase [Nostoc minutum NIES-26]|uniref:Dethiobiotin synthetase n=1 Tax=Nostoc minutum NIES-26 TaxID=1844469 RepID=A0A367RY83_9NOSO|nr:Dethiobiotin synthetase [Dendronalium sp. ChiSLP03b]MDZ8209147.1 Dethiobiotin synthetase [Dendronalium sp. ChiSLP03b]RCJ40791.1 Dethiobiotin synthetase [Nostoc minutum NIES-26]